VSDQETKVGKRNSLHEIPKLEPGSRDDEAVVSSTKAARASGEVRLGDLRVSEELAREVLYRRFTAFGAHIQSDYAFHADTVACKLDGYDPALHLGYVYVSHADEDVVTDIDGDAEMALHQLAYDRKEWILVLHDSNVRDTEQLAIQIDSFLRGLPRHHP
jgi:hypothetical protein